MRKETRYYHELEDGREVELPFDPEGADIEENQANGKIILSCLVRDDNPEDPFEGDEGEFYQFNHHYKHDTDRPYIEDFQEVIRANKGRVFYVDAYQEGYGVSHKALIKNATDIEDADGYYIAPEDVTKPEQYARGAVESYSDWCKGEVYGVCVWLYDAETLEELERDECWGYNGYKYAEEELKNLVASYMEEETK